MAASTSDNRELTSDEKDVISNLTFADRQKTKDSQTMDNDHTDVKNDSNNNDGNDEKVADHNNKNSALSHNFKNIIIILGQMLNKDGSAPVYMLQRLKKAVDLIKSQKLDLLDTLFIPTGSDVSNSAYGINTNDAKKKHCTEAELMKNILNKEYKIPNKNIVCEPQAFNTVQNFYYVFLLLYEKHITKVKNCFIVSSDFHIKRSRIFFQTLYTDDKTSKTVLECDNIEYFGAPSNATQQKYAREEQLIARFMPDAFQYQQYLWMELRKK